MKSLNNAMVLLIIFTKFPFASDIYDNLNVELDGASC